MSNFLLDAAEVLQVFRGTEYRMIDLRITFDDGKFEHRATQFSVVVRNDSARVESFFALLSTDHKAIHGYFTTDAFEVFTGNVDVLFGYLGQPIGVIANVSIRPAELPPFFVAVGAHNADNDWLANV
jgi:hypothetical protein